MRKMLNKLLIVMMAVGVLSGCSSSEPAALVTIKTHQVQMYSLDVSDKFDDASVYYQLPGSENVYIFNSATGNLYKLYAAEGKMGTVNKFPAVTDPEVELVGFTVDEPSKLVRFFYLDSAAAYTLDGKRKAVQTFRGLSKKGFVYPAHKSFLPVYKNGKMYAPFYPSVEDASKNPKYFSSPVEASVDLKTGKVTLLDQIYPSNYLENCYSYGTEPFRTEVSEDEHAYFFPQNDSVYIRDLKNGELTVKFFGSRLPKSFEFIPYDKINSVNASAFDELSLKNPFYAITYNFPLAGFFGRTLILKPGEKHRKYRQYVVLTDREFNYKGEMTYPHALMIDSKKGILLMDCSNGKLTISKLSW